MELILREIAFARAGDKGDTNNVNVATYDERDYEWLKRHLTIGVVERQFHTEVHGPIKRYEFTGSKMLNFVMERALHGGVSRSLNLDAHGKSRASLMLGIRIAYKASDVPPSRDA
ncbi:MAG TPA: hypothetical protein VNU19_19475 [Candidatus Acidoferrum sp.]|jgi:hypothetical protein|nr:hypothetical protein [Candidatus Acidoferrum sp.]